MRTPWVLRPISLMSPARMRWILPLVVTISTSSPSSNRKDADDRPLRVVVLMSRSPLPPRFLTAVPHAAVG